MTREAIVEGLRSELDHSKEELARLEAALVHVSKVPDEEQLITVPTTTPSAKRGRGRPKGSRNRAKDVIAAEKAQKPLGKKRGRPKGSKNKPKNIAPDVQVVAAVQTLTTPEQEPLMVVMDEHTTVSQPPEVSAIADITVVEMAPEVDTTMEQEMDVPDMTPAPVMMLADIPVGIQSREALFNANPTME